MSRLSAGDQAPKFTLAGDDGATCFPLRLSAASAWSSTSTPPDDTPGCTTEACQFNDSSRRFRRAEGFPVIGISPDDGDSHPAFREKYSLGFTLLSRPRSRDDERLATVPTARRTLYGKKARGRDSFDVSHRRRGHASNGLGTAREPTDTLGAFSNLCNDRPGRG
jgi:peroxiredoxin Q/BCP